MATYKSPLTEQTSLFPPSLDEMLPLDSPARLISNVVNHLNLKILHDTYSSDPGGQPPYHPAMLLKVVLYGYLTNVFSSRELEASMAESIALRWLSGNLLPDHTTISRFKLRCMPYIKAIFSQLTMRLWQDGHIDLCEDLYIDGTTIRSRAARRRVKWLKNAHKYRQAAEEEVQKSVNELLELVEKGDLLGEGFEKSAVYSTQEARQIAEGMDKSEQVKRLKGARGKITAVHKACDRVEAHEKTEQMCHGRCGVAPTDPECGIMHAKEDGYDSRATPNWNVQIATQNQLVTNYTVEDNPSDKSVAMQFVNTCIEENGVKPAAVVADAGYGCEEVYVGTERMGIEGVIKFPNYDALCSRRPVKEGRYDKYGFRPTPDQSSLICPGGHRMRVVRTEPYFTVSGFRSDSTVMTCDHCAGCPFVNECDLTKSKNGVLHRKLGNIREEEKAKARLDLPANREKLKRRSLEPEPVFGQLKHNHGFTRSRYFGKAKVTMDLGFMFMALNIKKVHKIVKKGV